MYEKNILYLFTVCFFLDGIADLITDYNYDVIDAQLLESFYKFFQKGTTITDVFGFLSFLGLASIFII